ncbi:helix-turn-helix transcriptional regulator [Adhaeribacter swui]|uniref:Helix-turn-helix transcriptional regulator n=1 Tax=Adhaeribacter swui TaxID=2086471 RepID=A0A7G7GDM5_9BACT|nr:helix-turn-helix transcriptional regulator [Adhaeribacter swui]QNF35259.1 helix-turn-helix transcriptional regulator [Adhaeribacter swui]
MKLKVIIEKNENELWARIEGIGDFSPVTVGNTTEEVLANLKLLINDYIQHEGAVDPAWNLVNVKDLKFEFRYDVQAFFQEFSFLKQSKIAELAGLNPSLVRQYASGVKHPSANQARKLEDAIHKLAQTLQFVSIYADGPTD